MGLCCGNPRLPYRNLASSDLSLERCAIETRLILNNRKPRKSLSLRNNRTPSTWIVAQSSRFRGISMHRRQVEDVEKRATIKKNASPSRRISDGWPVNISTATLLRIMTRRHFSPPAIVLVPIEAGRSKQRSSAISLEYFAIASLHFRISSSRRFRLDALQRDGERERERVHSLKTFHGIHSKCTPSKCDARGSNARTPAKRRRIFLSFSLFLFATRRRARLLRARHLRASSLSFGCFRVEIFSPKTASGVSPTEGRDTFSL